jgi:hypothetical protein
MLGDEQEPSDLCYYFGLLVLVCRLIVQLLLLLFDYQVTFYTRVFNSVQAGRERSAQPDKLKSVSEQSARANHWKLN